MKLPVKLPFLEKKPTIEYFLALLLRDEKATAVIIEEKQGNIRIIGRHEENFTTSLEEATSEELVQVLDKVISRTEGVVPPDYEVQNTIFGVKDTWVEDKKIKKDYLSKLKHVCDQLTLTPMGFIVLAEAIAHLMQKEEGAPVSALITEVGEQFITISLFRAGKIVEAHHTPVTDSPVKTVDALLQKFEKVEILPSRVILFNAMQSVDADESRNALAQKFIAHQWSKSLPFLHVPQISILPSGFDTKAIVAGAAEQLGFEMDILPADVEEADIKTYQKHHEVKAEKVIEKEREETEVLEKAAVMSDDAEMEKEKSEDASMETAHPDNFGFILDEDISTAPPPVVKHPPVSHKEHHASVGAHPPVKHESNIHIPEAKEEVDSEDEMGEDTPEERTHHKKSSPFAVLSGLTAPLAGIRRMKLPRVPLNNRLLFIPPVILLLLIGVVVLYIFQLKATVTLVVSPKMADEAEKITFSTTGSNDFSESILAAKDISITIDGSAETPATGQKEVGEKAKGSVTLYNSGDSKKTLKEGSTVTSSNGLVYLLDKEVSIASASGDIFTGIKSGTAQAAVTAKAIGSEYNLPSNTKFSVEGSSVLAAKNDSAFAGGSKKKVTVVAKKDLDKLANELPKSLEAKAKAEMQNKVGSNEVLLPEFTDITFEKQDYDKKLEEEAKTVKITAKVIFTSLSYSKDDVLQFAQTMLKNKFSQDQTIPEKDIVADVTGLKKKSDTEMTGLLEVRAGLLPKLDNPKIAKEITGKSYEQVDEYIKNLPQVQKADIVLSPNIPILPKLLPRKAENITVVIKPNE